VRAWASWTVVASILLMALISDAARSHASASTLRVEMDAGLPCMRQGTAHQLTRRHLQAHSTCRHTAGPVWARRLQE
jgi:hypothetical protein